MQPRRLSTSTSDSDSDSDLDQASYTRLVSMLRMFEMIHMLKHIESDPTEAILIVPVDPNTDQPIHVLYKCHEKLIDAAVPYSMLETLLIAQTIGQLQAQTQPSQTAENMQTQLEATLSEEKSESRGNTASLMSMLRQRQTSARLSSTGTEQKEPAPEQKTPVAEARSSNANSTTSRRPSSLDILSSSFGGFNTFITSSPTASSPPAPQEDETRNTNSNRFRDMCRMQ